jgi:hypothetical protein
MRLRTSKILGVGLTTIAVGGAASGTGRTVMADRPTSGESQIMLVGAVHGTASNRDAVRLFVGAEGSPVDLSDDRPAADVWARRSTMRGFSERIELPRAILISEAWASGAKERQIGLWVVARSESAVSQPELIRPTRGVVRYELPPLMLRETAKVTIRARVRRGPMNGDVTLTAHGPVETGLVPTLQARLRQDVTSLAIPWEWYPQGIMLEWAGGGCASGRRFVRADTRDLTLHLDEGGLARGRVVGLDGVGRGGVEIRIRSRVSPIQESQVFQTAPDGSFEVGGVGIGDRILVQTRGSGPLGARMVRWIDALRDGVCDLGLLRFGRRAPIKGVVVEASGDPIGGVPVNLVNKGVGGPSVFTALDGTFTHYPFDDGPFTLVVTLRGGLLPRLLESGLLAPGATVALADE